MEDLACMLVDRMSDHSGNNYNAWSELSERSISSADFSSDASDDEGGCDEEVSEHNPLAHPEPRIPVELQEIFVRSQRGDIIDEPPKSGVALFTRRWWRNQSYSPEVKVSPHATQNTCSSGIIAEWVKRGRDSFIGERACTDISSSKSHDTTSKHTKLKPDPIIKTRIPLDLQDVFLRSQRGEAVDKPPSSGAAFRVFGWNSRDKKQKTKKAVLSFGGASTVEFDHRLPTSTTVEPGIQKQSQSSKQNRWVSPETTRSFTMPKQPRRGDQASNPQDFQNPVPEKAIMSSCCQQTCPFSQHRRDSKSPLQCSDMKCCGRQNLGPRRPERGKSPLRERVERLQPSLRSLADLCVR